MENIEMTEVIETAEELIPETSTDWSKGILAGVIGTVATVGVVKGGKWLYKKIKTKLEAKKSDNVIEIAEVEEVEETE